MNSGSTDLGHHFLSEEIRRGLTPGLLGELVAERARTLLPLGGNGRSRAGGRVIRCPEEPRGPGQGRGTGRGMEGRSPSSRRWWLWAPWVFSKGQRSSLKGSHQRHFSFVNNHGQKWSLHSTPAPKNLWVEGRELVKEGKLIKLNTGGGGTGLWMNLLFN